MFHKFEKSIVSVGLWMWSM